ncbi:MAG: response regulator transcription factor [Alphaproteobacteria bacterium]|nr:response regulator transcription factor [Alphaproteobacteria bacterium]
METHRLSQESGANPTNPDTTTTLLILSEIRFLREGLADALKRDPQMSVMGLCGDLAQAIERLGDISPDILLMDAAFPGGVENVRRLRLHAPRTRIVVFAVTETEDDVIAWVEAGAAGYIPRTAALSDLVRLLYAIIAGEQVCSARVVSALMRRIGCSMSNPLDQSHIPSDAMLTLRERQIVGLVSAGLSNKEIARQLNIELSTAKSHVHNLLGKLHLQRRGQVAHWRRMNAAYIV